MELLFFGWSFKHQDGKYNQIVRLNFTQSKSSSKWVWPGFCVPKMFESHMKAANTAQTMRESHFCKSRCIVSSVRVLPYAKTMENLNAVNKLILSQERWVTTSIDACDAVMAIMVIPGVCTTRSTFFFNLASSWTKLQHQASSFWHFRFVEDLSVISRQKQIDQGSITSWRQSRLSAASVQGKKECQSVSSPLLMYLSLSGELPSLFLFPFLNLNQIYFGISYLCVPSSKLPSDLFQASPFLFLIFSPIEHKKR